MKTKSLLLAFAGLGLFACTNEDLKNGVADGNAVVSVKIDEPTLSRAIDESIYSSATDVTLNSIELVLTAQTGGAKMKFTPNEDEARNAFLNRVKEYQFEGVRNPSKMEVFINTEKSSGWTLTDVLNTNLAEPLYASSTNFISKGDTDGDQIDEYEVTLAPAHTVARLEFGGIKHIHTASKPCMFATINIDGIFMNNVAGATNGITNWATAQTNTPVHSVIGTEDEPVEFAEEQTWPAGDKCYGYNILPVTEGELPVLTVCFSNITIDKSKPEYSGVIWGNTDKFGYATVKNYKLSGTDANNETYKTAFGVGEDGIITKFPAGYIYQVKSLEIPDEAIGTTITGGEDVHVYAVVTVNPWTIVQGSVEWN